MINPLRLSALIYKNCIWSTVAILRFTVVRLLKTYSYTTQIRCFRNLYENPRMDRPQSLDAP